MIISILSEPRSGSSNLLYWFGQSEKFTVVLEPSNLVATPKYPQNVNHDVKIKNRMDITTWEYYTEHLVIKEILDPSQNYENLITSSDKIILLYRNDFQKQLESWLMSINTEKWGGEYFYDESVIVNKNHDYLIKIKENFKEYSNTNSLVISYEELYLGNGIKEILDYVGLTELDSIKFPYGKKFRKEINLI
jgi:hypothetical protein